MRPKELFGVVIRTIGLLTVLFSVGMMGMALLELVLGGPGQLTIFLIIGAPLFIFGMVFLSGVKPLVDWAYREEPDQ